MFEKEAEIYALSNFGFRGKNSQRVVTAKIDYQYGAEFGYKEGIKTLDDMTRAFNREHKKYTNLRIANEWHYVKDGDYPNTETKNYTYIRRRKRYERQFTDYRVIKCFVLCQNEKGKITAEVGYFDCNQKCFLNNAECIVIAWKEIVLPKESK